MDLCQGGELFEHIVSRGSFSEPDAAHVIAQVTAAVQHLHAHGIVHRDIKPENVLFVDAGSPVPWVKLADFGLATILKENHLLSTPCGTPSCVAPEVLLAEGYGEAVDMWSVGILLYILLCGYPPFQQEEDSGDGDLVSLYEQIIHGDFEFPAEDWASVHPEAKDLILRLLVVDPEARARPADVLQHPWIVRHADPVVQEAKKQMAALALRSTSTAAPDPVEPPAPSSPAASVAPSQSSNRANGRPSTIVRANSSRRWGLFQLRRKFQSAVHRLLHGAQATARFSQPSAEQIQQWTTAFRRMPLRDGRISRSALFELLNELGLDTRDPRMQHLRLEIDAAQAQAYGSSTLTAYDKMRELFDVELDLFLALCRQLPGKPSRDQVVDLFKRLDSAHGRKPSGHLSVEQLLDALHLLSSAGSERERERDEYVSAVPILQADWKKPSRSKQPRSASSKPPGSSQAPIKARAKLSQAEFVELVEVIHGSVL
jgi:serine/threonine protein kinase